MNQFYCCGVIRGTVAYRRHMDEAHEGRSDCVLGLTDAQALRILAGEPVSIAVER